MCISSAKNTLQHLYEQAVSTFDTTQQPKNVDDLDAVQQALRELLPAFKLYSCTCLPLLPLQFLHLSFFSLTCRKGVIAGPGHATHGMVGIWLA